MQLVENGVYSIKLAALVSLEVSAMTNLGIGTAS